MIPADLGDVLKNYTKEVVRRHPEDLLQFSAMYARAPPEPRGAARAGANPPPPPRVPLSRPRARR